MGQPYAVGWGTPAPSTPRPRRRKAAVRKAPGTMTRQGKTPFELAVARTPSEHSEQTWLLEWATANEAREPRLALLHSVPNGGKRHPVVAAKLKAEGQKAGVPDLDLPVARQLPDGTWHHGLRIEMKPLKGGRVMPQQKRWIELLTEQGQRCEVCRGWVAAALTICDHLGRPDLAPATDQ